MNLFAKDTIKLTTGTVIAQVITFLTIPLISRLYPPEVYGSFGIVTTILTIFSPLTTLHVHRTILLPHDDSEALNLLIGSLITAIWGSIIIFALLSLFPHIFFLKSWIVQNKIDKYLKYIPLICLLQGFSISLHFWLLRNRLFSAIAVSVIIQVLIDRCVTILYPLYFPVCTKGLIYGKLFGCLCFFASLIIFFLKCNIYSSFKLTINVDTVVKLVIQYSSFFLFSSLSMLSTYSSREIPTLILSIFFSPTVVGYYIFSIRVIRFPIRIIGEAISNVFLQRVTSLASTDQKDKISKKTYRLFLFLVYLSSVPALALIFGADAIFIKLFGPQWSQGGVYTQVLTLSFFSIFISGPFGSLFDAFKKQKEKFVLSTANLIVTAFTITIVSFIYRSPMLTVVSIGVTSFLYNLYVVNYLFKLLDISLFFAIYGILKKTSMVSPIVCYLMVSKLSIFSVKESNFLLLCIFLFLQSLLLYANVHDIKTFWSSISQKCKNRSFF